MRFAVLACALALGCTPLLQGITGRAAPRRALWVLAEGTHRTLESPERVSRLVDDAGRLGVTDLFVQVYRGGRSWFPSTHADPTPHAEILRTTGQDTLRQLVTQAHARGIRVHAWFNALCMAENANAPLLRALGRDAAMVDRQGRNILDYPGYDVPEPDHAHTVLGTPGIWLDPAAPGVVEYLVATLGDLVDAYPDLDGLHLDFIRHPDVVPPVLGSRFEVGLDFGYGAPSRARFEASTGQPFARGDAWDEFRRESVHGLVKALRARIPARWEHSAAVLPWVDRAYLSIMQDWRRWLEEGSLDFAVPMVYTKDDRQVRYQSFGLVGGIAGDRVWIGLGTWLFTRTPERARQQLAIAEAAAPRGIVLFSYDALVAAPDAMAALEPKRR